MKKLKCLSLLLAILTLMQCLALPVSAAETTEPTEAVQNIPMPPSDILDGADREEVFGTVSVQKGCRTLNGMMPLGGNDRILDSAQAAFLYEVNTDTVVYSYNPDVKLPPGNLAKVVTSLLALEICDLNDMVTVSSRYISKLPAGSKNVNLKDGEKLSVESLIHCMLMMMANDAAIAIAEHISGTQEAFVELMNSRVKQMGCTNTEFHNVHGLDNAGSYTTARDLTKITVEALKNEKFAEFFKVEEYTVPATERSKERSLLNTDHFITNRNIQDFYDPNVTGSIGAASSTTGAGLISVREEKGMKYIGVVLGCLRIMDEEQTWKVKIYGNYEEMTELFNRAFDKYKVNRILYEGMSLKQFQVSGGESNAVGQSMVNQDTVVPINATMDDLVFKYFIDKNGLSAPIAQDERIGTLEVWYRSSCVAEAEVFSMGNVRSMADSGVKIRSTAVRSDSDASGFLSVLGTICVIILGLAMAYLAFNAYMRSRIRAQRRRRREARRRNR